MPEDTTNLPPAPSEGTALTRRQLLQRAGAGLAVIGAGTAWYTFMRPTPANPREEFQRDDILEKSRIGQIEAITEKLQYGNETDRNPRFEGAYMVVPVGVPYGFSTWENVKGLRYAKSIEEAKNIWHTSTKVMSGINEITFLRVEGEHPMTIRQLPSPKGQLQAITEDGLPTIQLGTFEKVIYSKKALQDPSVPVVVKMLPGHTDLGGISFLECKVVYDLTALAAPELSDEMVRLYLALGTKAAAMRDIEVRLSKKQLSDMQPEDREALIRAITVECSEIDFDENGELVPIRMNAVLKFTLDDPAIPPLVFEKNMPGEQVLQRMYDWLDAHILPLGQAPEQERKHFTDKLDLELFPTLRQR